ncbi:hypothetical protein [Motiliproteus sp. MSK22-1]|uniref:hypothetical protein n=1 Tax=Motiliproteus sp. MSK22-1 TaxID=1897630 RepID=UPI00130160D7|nr:hypothetical protein [Motiliproteus sp. MSK22-1]
MAVQRSKANKAYFRHLYLGRITQSAGMPEFQLSDQALYETGPVPVSFTQANDMVEET